MKINRIGLNFTHNQNFSINRPSGSGDYLLLLIKSPAIVMLTGVEVVVEKHSILLYNKGTPQIYHTTGGHFVNDFIHFDSDQMDQIPRIPFDTVFPLPSVIQINKLLRDIYIEFISNNPMREHSMKLFLCLLLIKIKEVTTDQPKDHNIFGHYDTLLNLRFRMYEHPEEKWSIARLSKLASLSPSHFQRLYKNTFGVSCIEDVIACKIEYAKATLSGTYGTVREIATMCGYDNEVHFMRQFKREVGVTPSEYRKLINL